MPCLFILSIAKYLLSSILIMLRLLSISGMRIITQNVPGGTSAKILPKPSQLTSPSGAPVVVVSAGSSQSVTSTVAMLNRPITTFSGTIFNSGTNNHSAFKNLPLQIMHSFLG